MTGNRTHEQQKNIIEQRVNTRNAGKDFDATIDLQKSEELRERERQSDHVEPHVPVENDDLSILRGVNQESDHKKD
jgi:hypothetical protein